MILLDICILAFCGNDSRRRTATLWYFQLLYIPTPCLSTCRRHRNIRKLYLEFTVSGPDFTLITIVAIYDIVRQLSAIRARWIACFLVIIPPIVMFSRLCGEVFVLNPFLLFGTIWVYVRLCQSQKPYIRRTGFVLAGFLMSLGVWNHIIFLPSAVSLAICYAIFMWPGLRQLLINSGFCSFGFFFFLLLLESGGSHHSDQWVRGSG